MNSPGDKHNEPAETKRARLCWTFAPVLVLAALALSIGLGGLDRTLFLTINSHNPLGGDTLWACITMLGDTLVAISVLVFIVRKRPDIVWALVISAVIAAPIVNATKSYTDRLRPPKHIPKDEIHIIGPDHAMRSFPSGHSTTAFLLGSVIALMGLRKWWTRGLAIGISAVVALSRAVVGIHWPLDIVVGSLIGWSIGAASILAARRTPWGYGLRGRTMTATALILVAFGLTFMYDSGYDDAVWFQRIAGALCMAWGAVELVMIRVDARGNERAVT